MKKRLLYLGALISVFSPSIIFAQQIDLTNATNAFSSVRTFIDSLIALLVGIAILVVVYGIIKFIASGDDAAARKSGGAFMAYGIIGIFVMISIWGLVGFLDSSFTLSDPTGGIPNVPTQ